MWEGAIPFSPTQKGKMRKDCLKMKEEVKEIATNPLGGFSSVVWTS
jgi:hypothetical protein